MKSIENSKNQEDLFQIKVAIMSKMLGEFGGREGVTEILSLALDAHYHKEYQKSLKILEPLIGVLKEQPFVSNKAAVYVSISDEMEWALYQDFCRSSTKLSAKNVCTVCPMEIIWRQYGLSFLESGDVAQARDAIEYAIKWNPVSAKSRLMLAVAHGDKGRLDETLHEIISALNCAYQPEDMVHSFRLLRDYFICKKLYSEALYSSFLRSHFSSSNEVLTDILNDMVLLVEKVDFNYKDLNDEELLKTCQKYGFRSSFNPEVVAVAQRNYEEAFLAKETERAKYYAQIMAELKTEQEKRNIVKLRQFFESQRNIVS